MSSLKKYWFGANRENKPQCAKVFDSTESTVTSVTQSTFSLPEKSADCEQLLNRQCSAKFASTEATIITPSQQVCPPDSSSMNASAASSPSLISETTSQTIPENTLQKSTSKKKSSTVGGKKAAADKKGGATEKKGGAAQKKGAATEKKGAAAKGEKKATVKKAPAAAKKASTTLTKKVDTTKKPEEPKTPETTTQIPEIKEAKQEPTADAEKPVVVEAKTEPAAASEAPSAAPTKSAAAEKPVVGDETSPDARKKGKGAKAAGADEPKVGKEGSPGRKKGKGTKAAGAAKEPKAGEEESPGQPKGKLKGAADAEEPIVGEEELKEKRRKQREGSEGAIRKEEPSPFGPGGRPRRKRPEALTTKKVIISTPATTISSLYMPRRVSEKRKPFSRPLTFSSRTSTLDSLSEFERRQSAFHEEELLRAWRRVDSRLMKMLPTPMRRPMFLKDPPEMSFEVTLTTELRKDYAKRKIEAMQKPSEELVRDPLMLRFILPKMNKAEILRKKHIKKETIMSAYFEQHYDRFQKPPFKTIHLVRKCAI